MRCLFFSRSAEKKKKHSDRHNYFSWSFFGHGSTPSGQELSTKQVENSRSAPPSFVQSHRRLEQQQQQQLQKHVARDVGHAVCVHHVDVISHHCIHSSAENASENASASKQQARAFPFVELRDATQNFSHANMLGEGGFGCVFKGVLKLGPGASELVHVAVKQLNILGLQGHKEWLTEVHFLGFIEHPNVVKLIGYCAEDNERGIQRLLVYEYMVNRSLERYLFNRGLPVLTWEQRMSIMLGSARGLDYLHEHCQVIFRDFKTSNVLLDEKFNPKLSDFGLAREGPEGGRSHVSTSVVGTIGYAAPEYIQTGHLTTKSDVWSFGVVLLEMISGKRSVDRNRPKNEQHLLEWARPYLYRNKRIHNIMDPRLEGQYRYVQAVKVTELAIQCLNRFPRERPSMSTVVNKLQQIIELSEGGDDLFTAGPNNAQSPTIQEPIRLRRRQPIYRNRNILGFPKAVKA